MSSELLHVVSGNLLTSDCTVIGHQTNCMGVMGAGIALNIKHLFPEAYTAFMKDTRKPLDKFGSCSIGICKAKGKIVFNLYGQMFYGRDRKCYTNYDALERSIRLMLSKVKDELKVYKVGFPFGMGCGLAGGNWNVVEGILLKCCREIDMPVYLYKL